MKRWGKRGGGNIQLPPPSAAGGAVAVTTAALLLRLSLGQTLAPPPSKCSISGTGSIRMCCFHIQPRPRPVTSRLV